MEKSNLYQGLKRYLESGNVEELNEIVNVIGKTNFSKTIGIHYNTFRKRINKPERFEIVHIKRLAAAIQVDPRIIINLILDNLDKKSSASTKK